MYSTPTFQIHGNAANSGDSVAGQVEKLLTFIEGLAGNGSEQAGSLLMPGLSEMANYHPLFVHFPIALLTLFFLLDFVGTLLRHDNMRHAASWFLYLGTLGALATVLMGFQAAEGVAHGAAVHPIMERHQLFGISLTSIAVILTFWRILTNRLISGMANVLHLLLAAIMCVLLVLGADLGGLMVYKYGVSVKAVPAAHDSDQHQHGH